MIYLGQNQVERSFILKITFEITRQQVDKKNHSFTQLPYKSIRTFCKPAIYIICFKIKCMQQC